MKAEMVGGMAQEIEYLLSKCKPKKVKPQHRVKKKKSHLRKYSFSWHWLTLLKDRTLFY
jgi:hypothetical protein